MAKKKNPFLLWVLGIILIGLGGWYVISEPPTTISTRTQPLDIGVITPLTGDFSIYGSIVQNTLDLVAKDVNDAGGIDGRDIFFIYKDGQCNRDVSAQAARALSEEGIEVVLGGTCPEETIGGMQGTMGRDIVFVSPGVGHSSGTMQENVYRLYPSAESEAQRLATHAISVLGAKTAVILAKDTLAAQEYRVAFREAFEGLGGNVLIDVVEEPHQPFDRSFLLEVRDLDPDVIYVLPSTSSDGRTIFKQIEVLNIEATRMTAPMTLNQKYFTSEPELFEGVLTAGVGLNASRPAIAELVERYENTYGAVPEIPMLAVAVYDVGQIIVDAAREHNELRAENVEVYLSGVKNREGVIGNMTFNENHTGTLGVSVFQIQDGVFEEEEINRESTF